MKELRRPLTGWGSTSAKSLVRLRVPARALELVPQSDYREDQTYSYGRCKADLVHTSYLRLFQFVTSS